MASREPDADRRTRWLLTAAVGATLLAGFLPAVLGGLLLTVDEGIHLATAKVILDGGTLGLDAAYPKVGTYLTAAWLAVFGETLAAARVYVALIGVAVGLLLFELLRRRLGWLAGLGAAVVFGCWSVPHWPTHTGDWSGVLCGFLAVLALLAYTRSRRPRDLGLAGLAMGVAGLFFPDLALFLLLAGGAAAFVVPGPRKNLAWLFGGVFLVAGLVALPLAAAGALFEVADVGVLRPIFAAGMFDRQYLSYPTGVDAVSHWAYYGRQPVVLLVYLVPPACLLAGVGLLWRGAPAERPVHTVLLAGAAASLLTLYPRADLFHLVLALPLALPVLFVGGATAVGSLRRRLGGAAGQAPVAAAMILILGLSGLGLFEVAYRFQGPFREVRGVPALAGVPVRAADAERLEALSRTLQARLRPGEMWFAFPDLSLYYFLFDHPPPTRFLDQTFGWIDRSGDAEVVAALERTGVRLAVRLYSSRPGDGRPLSATTPRLEEYMAQQFREVERIGELTVLERR